MKALDLIRDLHQRGVTLEIEDDQRLRVEAPPCTLTRMDRVSLTEHRDAIVEHLRKMAPGSPDTSDASPALTDEELSAVLIHSSTLDAEVWLVRDVNALEDIAGEIHGRAVFFFEEIDHLRGKSHKELRAIAMTKRIFGPMAKVVQ